jgi:hypothetical protein
MTITNFYLDIETIPAQRPDVMEEIRAEKQAELDAALASINPPGNIKKQETIDEWMATEAPKAAQKLTDAFESDVDEAYRKTGLDGAFGQVCVLGFAVNDGEVQTVQDMSEESLFDDFAVVLRDLRLPDFNTCVIGHNVLSFDLRFLVQRHIVNQIKPPFHIIRASQAKPWETDKVFDTMAQWAGVGGRIKLSKLCKALGIQSSKNGMDGSQVWDYVKAARLSDVATYCNGDVEDVRMVHKLMTFSAIA